MSPDQKEIPDDQLDYSMPRKIIPIVPPEAAMPQDAVAENTVRGRQLRPPRPGESLPEDQTSLMPPHVPPELADTPTHTPPTESTPEPTTSPTVFLNSEEDQ